MKKEKSEQEWRVELTPAQYAILRQKKTEAPFSGEFNDEKRPGRYKCAGCGEVLFMAADKFNSGTGWPSFEAPVSGAGIKKEVDRSLATERTEVLCAKCGGHLGHVFEDGPTPTGKRYCINSAALCFEPGPGAVSGGEAVKSQAGPK